MDGTKVQMAQRQRFLKLSLKKNRRNLDERTINRDRSLDVIILDESLDKLTCDVDPKTIQPSKVYSPIIIDDSCDIFLEEDLPKITITNKTPSKMGNVSFNKSQESPMRKDCNESQPSIGGWSPSQHIICAKPRHETVPSTPKDIADESLEECSIKKIQQSQKKLLNELYGEAWKSIPTLFKTKSIKHDNCNGAAKTLYFGDDYDDDAKENIRPDYRKTKELYLTSSDVKRNVTNFGDTDKKSKKKLYTEKIPNIPEPKLMKPKTANTTSKKAKNTKVMSVTELVNVMKEDVDVLTKRVESVTVTPTVKRLTFMASLADNVPSWRCHTEAIQYRDSYNTLKEQLVRRLYKEFNRVVFDDALDADMPIIWDTKLRSTAGTTINRLVKNSKGDRIKSSSIKLSTKVVDAPQRLRDTLIHELCHAATWLIDGELRAGHGPLWKKWATRSLRAIPELGEISRCHNMTIHFKYCYKCTKCGYSVQRHSKSIDITKKCCGYCRGTFEIIINKKNKDGVVVSTPARKCGANDFALYVKENYASVKNGAKTHAQVMKLLGEQFSAKKSKPAELT